MTTKTAKKDSYSLQMRKEFVEIPAEKFAKKLIEKDGSRADEFWSAFNASRRSFFSDDKLAASDS